MTQQAPPFAAQRILLFALLFGMTSYAIVVAVVLATTEGIGLAEEPITVLDTVTLAVGAATAFGAIVAKIFLGNRAASLDGAERGRILFMSRLIPIAILEGGCLLSVTVWLLNGNAVPSLAVAMVLLAIAIAIVPFHDPDASRSDQPD